MAVRGTIPSTPNAYHSRRQLWRTTSPWVRVAGPSRGDAPAKARITGTVSATSRGRLPSERTWRVEPPPRRGLATAVQDVQPPMWTELGSRVSTVYRNDEDRRSIGFMTRARRSLRRSTGTIFLVAALSMVMLTGASSHAKPIRGTAGDDVLVGTARPDVIRGKQGADLLRGRSGSDHLVPGWGSDTAYGGRGSDDLEGGRGDDLYFGGPGDDQVYSGGDAFSHGYGDDTAFGQRGNDVLYGERGKDDLHGGPGRDSIVPGRGRDEGYGGIGRDGFVMQDDGRPDTIDCGKGWDTVGYYGSRPLPRNDQLINCERVHLI